jgi:hypothetical protein
VGELVRRVAVVVVVAVVVRKWDRLKRRRLRMRSALARSRRVDFVRAHLGRVRREVLPFCVFWSGLVRGVRLALEAENLEEEVMIAW